MRRNISVYRSLRKEYDDGHMESGEYRDRMVAAVRQRGGNASVRLLRGLLTLCRNNETFFNGQAISTHLRGRPQILKPFIDGGIVEVNRDSRLPTYRIKPEFK